MRYSLIMATKGRTSEVSDFLLSLTKQTYKDFEVIIVDQNEDNRLLPIIRRYRKDIEIKYVRSSPGLSKARNVGLKAVTGDIIAFPDDDCTYPANLLEEVLELFKKYNDLSGITGRSINQNFETNNGRFSNKQSVINKFSVWNKGISYTIFLKREVIEKIGYFDERLGVGAGTPWGSGEETDYLIRAISYHFKIMYFPFITVFHPSPLNPYSKEMLVKTYNYACGMGFVLRKHKYPFWFFSYLCLRPIFGMLRSLFLLDMHKFKHSLSILRGRLRGWLHYKMQKL
ncbi:glycosyltransferase [Geobacillus kaustophilus HTA426]|uniref:Glycosyltransferase n=1 Tax=Geobacillus kaustophilus (strain HTA426) TaxID=235909 RepID=Q5KUN8_GEOKA|nr:glycosyltransferase family A protein [Geobacillus kaustophilus]BAD77598.1 glycosyltransferase [Geobacillus kaustophilus HTA426]